MHPGYLVEVVITSTNRGALAYVWPLDALEEIWQVSALDTNETRAHLDRCAAWRVR